MLLKRSFGADLNFGIFGSKAAPDTSQLKHSPAPGIVTAWPRLASSEAPGRLGESRDGSSRARPPEMRGRKDRLCVNAGYPFEGREMPNGFSRLLLGETKFVEALQVKPELHARVEEMGETQGGVARDGTLSAQNAGDAVGRHVEIARQFGGAHAEFLQFLGEMLSWVDGCECQDVSFLLVIIKQSLRLQAPVIGPAARSKSAIDHDAS
jgi:hypothetical protein